VEQARRPALAHHVPRPQGLGEWVLINAGWYKSLNENLRPAEATSCAEWLVALRGVRRAL
jgi:hypothetical protein